jgi:acyl carrier protein
MELDVTDNNKIYQQLSELIAAKTKLNADIVKPDLNLEASGLDSFARIELILVIEEHFGIELSDNESANIATVADLVEIISAKVD